MSRGPDAATLLDRALAVSARAAGVEFSAQDWTVTRWASATFEGARHVLHLDLRPSAAARDWLAALPEVELPVRGHLVADVVVASCEEGEDAVTARVEILTVEERR
jgi:hypothetical protein